LALESQERPQSLWEADGTILLRNSGEEWEN
jgi:hypothetical protein